MDSDRNLLFGVLALQADLIDPTRFVEACTLWASHKQTPLPDLLVQRGWLTPEDRADVERLLERKLRKHQGDAKAGLAEVTSDPVKQSLAAIDDPDVRQSLAGLTTPPAPGQILHSTTAHIPGSRDRYTLTRLHASGGIGRVWLAHDDSLGRGVALKELRPERLGHATVWARFLKEAQVTGQLEHPGIVPIYEVGKRPGDETPFYTMRFIRGRTLAEAAAAYHQRRTQGEAGTMELRGLLGAFVSLCNAVAYAHSRGVLHRDLKPQNVVLGDYGEVILLDWGLAKLMNQAEEEGEIAPPPLQVASASEVEGTVQGQVLGTPAYMAPEQAEGRLDLLGPATDVYGLGAILYEVLTGKPPFTGSDTAAVMRNVIHDSPPRPRLFDKAVPPPLEAVCLKALAKKPPARYGTAKDLADDVQRWLADEPVSVHRDTIAVRLGRWARKHRTTVAVAAALLQTAVVVLAVSVVLISRSRAQVERERQRADAVNAFLVKDLLAQADPRNNPEGAKLTVRELLDKAAAAVETSPSIKQSPEVEGSVRSVIGNTYYGLGLYKHAREQLELAVACQDRVPDVPASQRFFTKNRLCWVVYKLGSFDETMARQILDQARAELGPDHEQTVYAADTLATIMLGNSKTTEKNNEAFDLLRGNLATQQRVLGLDHPLTIRAALNLADGLMSNSQGDTPRNLTEAQTVMLAARDASKSAFTADQPERLYFESALGFLYARQGKFAEAREVLIPLQEHFLKAFGPDHIDIARYWENLALAEEGLGNFDAAEALLRKTYAVRKNALGGGHGLTRRAAAHLGRVCMDQGKTEEAIAWLRLLLTDGVTRTGHLAEPADKPPRFPPRGADVNLLGGVLHGKGDPGPRAELLDELGETLEWISWRNDWFRVYVTTLRFEAACYRPGMRKDEIASKAANALPGVKQNIRILETNPATLPRLLDEARALSLRLQEAAASQQQPQ